MTTTALAPPATSPARASALRVLLRTCRAEWLRLWTVKATWWFLLAGALIMIGIATLAGFDAGDQSGGDAPVGDPAWTIAEIIVLPAQFAFLALTAMAVTSDYATGGIVPTLQWTPRRGVLAVARTLVGRTVAAVEQQLILDTLTHCFGNRTHAANILGISIRTLRNKLKEYSDGGVSVPAPQSGLGTQAA